MIVFGLSRRLFRSGRYGRATTVVYTIHQYQYLVSVSPSGTHAPRRALSDKNTPSMPHVLSHTADK